MRSGSPSAPARYGATGAPAPPGGTKRQAWTGIVPPWTNPNGSTRATSIRRSASRSPTGCARAIRSAPSPGCRDATPARSAARSSATGIPGPATASPAAPSRRRPAGSNAPDRARRPRARDCGTRSPPGCAGIGARSRYPADRRRCSRIMVTCTRASKPSTRPSTCRPGADSGRS